ncbi:MAG: thiamine phosphate synthase [Gammaproteobacteria bacterium]|nr:thiamine phosphate synthase [Gammaproteobacteria bacterium]
MTHAARDHVSLLQRRGLYAITDGALIEPARLVERVTQALRGGAVMVQYRNKSTDTRRRLHEARALREVCRAHGALLIVNDDVALARAVTADGVHLGKDDAPLAQARRMLGERAVIGLSCYNSLQRAVEAQSAGADYVAFGRFFSSRTKPDAVTADVELLRQAKIRLRIPRVAIGGITPDNGAALIEAGADLLAVVHGVFGQPDPEEAARRYAQLFEHPS